MHGFDGDTALLAQYIAAFEKLDTMETDALGVHPLLRASAEAVGGERLRFLRIATAPSALEALYEGLSLPGLGSTQFPRLYEGLVLSYRWSRVDLGDYILLGNELAEDLSPLLAEMRADENLFTTLLPNGYVQFGRGADGSCDPVCFDFRGRQRNGDCRVVRLDHEAVLCHGRIREVGELAPSYRSLVLATIERAGRSGPS